MHYVAGDKPLTSTRDIRIQEPSLSENQHYHYSIMNMQWICRYEEQDQNTTPPYTTTVQM